MKKSKLLNPILVRIKKNSIVDSLFGSWGRGVNGKNFLKKVRYGKDSLNRDSYLKSLWKKS